MLIQDIILCKYHHFPIYQLVLLLLLLYLVLIAGAFDVFVAWTGIAEVTDGFVPVPNDEVTPANGAFALTGENKFF